MGKGKGAGENSKKAAGNARKAETAARKNAEVAAKHEAAEDEEWSQGSKTKPSKKALEAAKKEEARVKKAERDRELELETALAASKKPQVNQRKPGVINIQSNGIDTVLSASASLQPVERRRRSSTSSSLDSKASNRRPGSNGQIDLALAHSCAVNTALNAHSIDDAIAALELTTGNETDKIDRHPERRFKAALRAYEERRLPEIRKEHPGLRLNQYQQRIFEEFKKSKDNPFNQNTVAFNANRNDVDEVRDNIRTAKEEKLAY